VNKRGLPEVGQGREESRRGKDPAPGPVGGKREGERDRKVAGGRGGRGWTKERNVRSVARVCNILS